MIHSVSYHSTCIQASNNAFEPGERGYFLYYNGHSITAQSRTASKHETEAHLRNRTLATLPVSSEFFGFIFNLEFAFLKLINSPDIQCIGKFCIDTTSSLNFYVENVLGPYNLVY